MDFENISVRVENQVGWMEYNRPPVNAVHWEMLRELPQAIQCLLEDDDVRVIVFARALEKYFSTGADLRVFDLWVLRPGNFDDEAHLCNVGDPRCGLHVSHNLDGIGLRGENAA